MADQIAFNGTAFASLRVSAWHNKGTVLKEEVTGEEMLKAANLDWEVEKRPVLFQAAGGLVEHPDYRMLVKGDTGTPFSPVGVGFEVYQNKEIISYFSGLVRDRKIVYETAGALRDGSTVWVMANIPDLSYSVKGDETRKYMLITNSHGDGALKLIPTDIRVVCANTLRQAENAVKVRRNGAAVSLSEGYSIKHTRNMRGAVNRVQDAFNKILEASEGTKLIMESLADVAISNQVKKDIFDFALGRSDIANEDLSGRAETIYTNNYQALERIFESETNQQPGTRNTLYSALQTVVEWVDHERPTRNDGRFVSAMFGSGDALKGRVFEHVLAMV